jgi:hypothetical protein
MEENLTPAERDLVSEIDISREAGLLRFLRLADYTSIILCGLWLMGTLEELLKGGEEVGFSTLLRAAVLGLAVYVGWRHMGAIDLYFWQSHLFTLLLLLILCAVVISTSWGAISSPEAWNPVNDLAARRQGFALGDIFKILIVGIVSLLGIGALIGLVTGRISHKNLSLLDLLTEISTPESLRRRPKLKIARVNLSLGVLTAIAGGAILIIIGGVPWEDQKNLARFLWFSDAVVVFGFFLLGLSRNYLQFDMDSLLSADTREPILFLRSFKDDELGEYNASQRSFLDYSLETRLATHFVRAGPFIAVRDPSVAILLPGAARKVLPDSEWKNQVVEWIAAASVIVMYAGKTDSLQWELRKVIEVGKVPNLILMTPEAMILKHPSEAGVRFEHIKTAFSETKWAPALAALPSAKSIRALIFKPDGTAVVVTSRKTNRDSWHLAALIAHFILRENASGVGVTRSATDKNQLLQR